MLKNILDETSRGCYDFMYLRIGKSLPLTYTSHKLTRLPDFANNCKYVVTFPSKVGDISHIYSVGYAFINFVDVSPFTFMFKPSMC